MILFGFSVATLLWADLTSLYVWGVLFVTLGYGAIGFYDDILKVTKRASVRGFSGRARVRSSFLIAGLAVSLHGKVRRSRCAIYWLFPLLKDLLIPLGVLLRGLRGMLVIVGAWQCRQHH